MATRRDRETQTTRRRGLRGRHAGGRRNAAALRRWRQTRRPGLGIAVRAMASVATVNTPRGAGMLRLPSLGVSTSKRARRRGRWGELLDWTPAWSSPALPGSMACAAGWRRIDRDSRSRSIVIRAHRRRSRRLTPRRAGRPGGGRIAVLGSAGGRDTAKRVLQGRVAGERCRLGSRPTRTAGRGPDGDPGAEFASGARRQACGLASTCSWSRITGRDAARVGKARPGDVVLSPARATSAA